MAVISFIIKAPGLTFQIKNGPSGLHLPPVANVLPAGEVPHEKHEDDDEERGAKTHQDSMF